MTFWNRSSLRRAAIGSAIMIAIAAVLVPPTAWLLSQSGPWSIWEARVLFLPILIASCVATLAYDRMPLGWAGLGLDRWTPRLVAAGLALGAVAAVAAALPAILAAGISTRTSASAGAVALFAAFLLVGAITEELLFRGYLFTRLAQVAGPLTAAAVSSLAFAGAHAWNPAVTPLAMVNILLAGVLFSAARLRSDEVWLPSALHAGWNIALAVGTGLPLSGIDFRTSVLRVESSGAELLTGGAFGPEGGVAATLALVAATVAVHRWSATEMSPYLHARVFRSVFRKQVDDELERGDRSSAG